MESHDNMPTHLPKIGAKMVFSIGLAVVVVFGGMFLVRYHMVRAHADELASDAQQYSAEAPVANVVMPKPSAANEELTLPGDVMAMQETAIYARVNGYLKRWQVDIQGHVEAGQLLAEIDAPDVDAQLNEARAALDQAKANVVSAQTNNDLAQATYLRYKGLIPTGGVTQQDLDTKQSAAAQAVAVKDAAEAAVKSAQASIQRLEAQQGFEKIIAPFSGTITTRNYDVGALISPTDTAAGHELFRIAETDKLRIWVNVPQGYVTLIKAGEPVYFTVLNYPGRKFTGHVARSAGVLDLATRTLRTELDFDNSDGALWAGMYGQITFDIHRDATVLTVPTSALVFDAGGTQVALVQDNKVHFQKITVGRDMGTEIEVATGLSADDRVISNPGEKMTEGTEVQVADASGTVSPAAHADAAQPASPPATTQPAGGQKMAQVDPAPSDPPGSASK